MSRLTGIGSSTSSGIWASVLPNPATEPIDLQPIDVASPYLRAGDRLRPHRRPLQQVGIHRFNDSHSSIDRAAAARVNCHRKALVS